MKTALKIAAWIFGGLLGLVVICALGAYLFIKSDYIRSIAENHADTATGRKTKIGNVDISWGSTTHIKLSDVNLSNTAWGKAPHMFEASLVDLDIRLWPLLRGRVEIPTIILKQPKIALERDAKGQSNWSFSQSPVAASAVTTIKPEERSEAPAIGHLDIQDGRISYDDQQRKLSLTGKINTALGEAAGSQKIQLSLKGTVQNRPLSLQFTGGSVLMLQNSKAPYPIDLDVGFGATKISLNGRIADPFKFEGANVKLHLEGPDLADVFPLLGIPAPPTPPYELTGNLERSGDVFKMTHLQGRIGKSDMAGSIAVDNSKKKSLLTADLTSQNLNFDDLGPLIGVPPSSEKGDVASTEQTQQKSQLDAQQNLFPDKPLHVELLREMDMDVSLDAKHVTAAPYLPVKALSGHVKIDDGNAVVSPFKLAVAGGRLGGEIGLDASGDKPVAKANLDFQELDLKEFFRDSKYFTTTNGKVFGHVELKGTGHSLAEVFGHADGKAGLAMTGGSISGLLIDLAGLDIGHALILYITEDNRLPIRCAFGRMTFNDGTAVFDRTRMDTERSVVHVDGQTQLNQQTLDMKIRGDAKKFSLLNLEAPVFFKGKIRSPAIEIGKKVPIPLIETGGAKDLDCQAEIKNTLSDMTELEN